MTIQSDLSASHLYPQQPLLHRNLTRSTMLRSGTEAGFANHSAIFIQNYGKYIDRRLNFVTIDKKMMNEF